VARREAKEIKEKGAEPLPITAAVLPKKGWRSMFRNMKLGDPIMLLLIALPGLLYFAVFKYFPLLGNIIAFQNYNVFKGIGKSDWVGFQHFLNMFTYAEFYDILINSLLLGMYSIAFGFPAPLLLALLLNEVRKMWFKRTLQTVLYLPHFLSWIIVGGIFLDLLALDGFVNQILQVMGMKPINFVTESNYYRGVLVISSIWKEVGWGMIIYLAAMAGINPQLYEAAMVDGAGRFRQMWSITLPSIMPAVIALLLLRVGHLLDANVEQMLVFLNPLVRNVGEVFDTYIYRVGLQDSQYSYTTAIGFFKAGVSVLLVFGLNQLSKRTTGESIY
jgi:putative aldouronate transport system permease protein